MSLPVDVRSVQVLSDFRAAMCRFGEDAKNALAAAEMEISRMNDWINNDRRLYWQGEIHRRKEELSRAKSELFRKRTSQMFGREGSFSEQRDNEREAKQRLEMAEKKLEKVRQWVQPLQQAVMEYRGASRPLADMIDSDLERALSLLERMICALEQYAQDAPPSTSYVQAAHSSPADASPTGGIASARRPGNEEGETTPAAPTATATEGEDPQDDALRLAASESGDEPQLEN